MSSSVWRRSAFSLTLFFASNVSFVKIAKAQRLSLKTESFKKNNDLNLNAGLSYYNFFHNQDYSSSYAIINSKVSLKNFKLEGFGWFSLDQSRVETYSVKELYYKTAINNFNVYVGRRVYSWTELEEFKPTGFWNNAWDFNKTDPVIEGFFGVFLERKVSSSSRLNLFLSPVSVPKIVTHNEIRNQQGDVVGQTPWSTPPPQNIDYNGSDLPVRYNLGNEDYLSLVSNFQMGASFDFENERAFVKTSYLYGGAKDIDLSLDFVLDSSDEDTPVQISVEPETYRVHRLGVDVGVKWSKGSRTGFSFNHRERIDGLLEDSRKSFIGVGSGSVYQLYHRQRLGARYSFTAFLNENTAIQNETNGELGQLLEDYLSVPFRFVRGGGLNLETQLTRSVSLSSFAYYDVEMKGVLGRLQTQILLENNMALNFGMDIVEPISNDSGGFYKEFRRNDFAYGSLAYVF